MSIKSLRDKLQKLTEQSEAEVLKRQMYWESKSDAWRESDKGEDYLMDTDALDEGIDLLHEAMDYFVESENK